MEFWGDEVEEIRYFTVVDQRSLAQRRCAARTALWAPPCRELLLTDDVQQRAAALLAEHPELAELLDPISRGEAVEGMEALAPVLVDELHARAARAARPARTSCSVIPERIRTRAADLVRTSAEFLDASWAAAAGGGKAPVDLGAASLRELDDVRDEARAPRAGRGGGSAPSGWTEPSATPTAVRPRLATRWTARSARRRPTAATSRPRWPTSAAGRRDGWRMVLVFDGHGPAQRAVERLRRSRPSGPVQRRRDTRAGRGARDHRAPAGRPARARAAPRRISPRPTSPASAGR